MKAEIQHDGNVVRALVSKRGISIRDFARRMKVARSTLDRMLDDPNWPSNHLSLASKILEQNLFAPYVEAVRINHGVLLLRGEKGMKVYALESLDGLDLEELKSTLDWEDKNDTKK